MAENEILDVRYGRRWRATRQLIKSGTSDPVALADSICLDAEHAVRGALKDGFKKGATFVALFRAANGSVAGMKAAVSLFPDRQLAGLAVLGCRMSENKSEHDIGHEAATLMFDRFVDLTLLQCREHEGWRSEAQRQQLRSELEQRRQDCVERIATQLEKSLRGLPAKGPHRRRAGERVTPRALVSRSLRPVPMARRVNE
jgi:hypothetical protein